MAEKTRRFMPVVRTLHVYLSMLGLVLIASFAATGLLMNHDEWFGLNEGAGPVERGHLPADLMEPLNKEGIEAELRGKYGAAGKMVAFEADDEEVRVAFKRPGRWHDVTILRKDGSVEIVKSTRGPLGILTDLHKGSDAGGAWKWVIDAAAVLLLSVWLTGLILWFSLPKRRVIGLIALVTGVGACVAAYVFLTP